MLSVPQAQVFTRPPGMSAQDGASIPVNHLTAWQLMIVMGGFEAKRNCAHPFRRRWRRHTSSEKAPAAPPGSPTAIPPGSSSTPASDNSLNSIFNWSGQPRCLIGGDLGDLVHSSACAASDQAIGKASDRVIRIERSVLPSRAARTSMVWSDFVVSSSSQRRASRSASMRTARALVLIGRIVEGRSPSPWDYLSASIRRRRRPGNEQDAILIVSRLPSASSISIVVREITTRSTAVRRLASWSMARRRAGRSEATAAYI